VRAKRRKKDRLISVGEELTKQLLAFSGENPTTK
jgi:hypothetical protein